jgi:hypothetical protein
VKAEPMAMTAAARLEPPSRIHASLTRPLLRTRPF